MVSTKVTACQRGETAYDLLSLVHQSIAEIRSLNICASKVTPTQQSGMIESQRGSYRRLGDMTTSALFLQATLPCENDALQDCILEVGLVDHSPIHQRITQISILRFRGRLRRLQGDVRRCIFHCQGIDTSKFAFATTALMK